MGKSLEYWVEICAEHDDKLIYELWGHDVPSTVFLLQNHHGKLNRVFTLGTVVRINKRGVTFRSSCISVKSIEVFMSRGDFDVYNSQEWEALDFFKIKD